MSAPYFYEPILGEGTNMHLSEATSKHVVQVLRMGMGEALQITNGKGVLLQCVITNAHKKHCEVRIVDSKTEPAPELLNTICISPLKNSSRFEWFLEKAAELGINKIVPLICSRTGKQKLNQERLQNILVSAMLQSKQVWITELTEPVKFVTALNIDGQKFIAHCEEEDEKKGFTSNLQSHRNTIFIGPEGDFTPEEIQLALNAGFVPVSLGSTRLRTETAGVAAAVVMALGG